MAFFSATKDLFTPMRAQTSIFEKFKQRGQKKESLWFGHLAKLSSPAVIVGDLRLVFALAELEANPRVLRYKYEPSEIAAHLALDGISNIEAEYVDFIVTFDDQSEEWWHVSKKMLSHPGKVEISLGAISKNKGASFVVRTLKDISPWENRFHNWLDLSQAMASTRLLDCSSQVREITNFLQTHRLVSYGQLLIEVSGDPALTRGAIARLIQSGFATVDLTSSILHHDTPIELAAHSATQDLWRRESATDETRGFEPCGHGADNQTFDGCGSNRFRPPDAIQRGRPRSLIGAATPDPSSWPPLVESGALGEKGDLVTRRKLAVELYARDANKETIESLTKLPVAEARRLFKRCTATDEHGRLIGYNGVLPYSHVKSYTRTKKVEHSILDKSCGYAGEFGRHLQDFEESRNFIANQILPKRENGRALKPTRKMYEDWLEKLREIGISEPEWPFCSTSAGEQSYFRYARALYEERAYKGRSGGDDLVRALRPLTFMQLDYKKTDAAGILSIENSYHAEVNVPIRRWYTGIMCCEKSTAIVGLATLFEIEPSCDCGLETVISALDPSTDVAYPDNHAEDMPGQYLLRHYIDELKWNGWLVLRVDNALANRAYDFIENIIDTVGCWVQFGPSYYWPTRHQIERTIGIVTRAGELAMRSSYGSSPSDPRRKDPEGEATRRRIRASNVLAGTKRAVSRINTKRSDGNEAMSRIGSVRAALAHPDVGTYARPLPVAVRTDHHLLGHYERRMVHREHSTVIYIKIDRSRYRNKVLSLRPDLVGKYLSVYVGRRDATRARAFVEATGEDLGTLIGSGGYCQAAIPWAFRKLIERGSAVDPPEEWRENETQAIVTNTKRTRTVQKRANRLASAIQREILRGSSSSDSSSDGRDSVGPHGTRVTEHNLELVQKGRDQQASSDPFGINVIPDLGD